MYVVCFVALSYDNKDLNLNLNQEDQTLSHQLIRHGITSQEHLLQHYHLILIKTEPRTTNVKIAKDYLIKTIALLLNYISVKEC